MGKVSQQKKGIKHNQMVDLDILSVLPQKPKLKKKNEILRVKVVETYKKKIVVGEEKASQPNRNPRLWTACRK